MEGVFEHNCRLYYGDFDCNGNIRISTLLHIMSDVAGIACENMGYSREWMLQRGQVFLLSQIRVTFLGKANRDERIRVATWADGTKGVLFLRHFRVTAEDGSLIAEAASTWILVNPTDRKILRPKDLAGEVITAQVEPKPALPQKLRYNADALIYGERATRPVRYTDLDLNHHVYNARYADMIYDVIPEADAAKTPAVFQITYKQEAVLGDTLTIGLEQKEGEITAVGTRADGAVSFEARLIFA